MTSVRAIIFYLQTALWRNAAYSFETCIFTRDINVIKVFRSSNLINSGSGSSNATRLEMNRLKSVLSLHLKKKKRKTVESSSYHVGFFCLYQSKLKAQSHFRHRTSCLVSDGARIRRGQAPASRAANCSSASANYAGCSVPRITVGMDPPTSPPLPSLLPYGSGGQGVRRSVEWILLTLHDLVSCCIAWFAISRRFPRSLPGLGGCFDRNASDLVRTWLSNNTEQL